MTELSQLAKLAAPFPDGFIEKTPGRSSAAYVAHHIVNQWLLGILGPFCFELVELIRGDVAAIPPNPQGSSQRAKRGAPALSGAVVGGVWRLRCTIDGTPTVIEEVGDCEDPHNWPHDGARAKDAASDALKRCAMRIGLGLHLWAQEHYVLDKRLSRPKEDGKASPDPGRTPVQGAATGDGAGKPVEGDGGALTSAAPHPAGEGDNTPADAAVQEEPAASADPADGSSLPPADEPVPDMGANETAAERAFREAGFTVGQVSELLVERWPDMAAQYTPAKLRKLTGSRIVATVSSARSLRERKRAIVRAQDEHAEMAS